MGNQLISKIDIEQFDKNNFMDMLNSFPSQIDEIVNAKDIVLNYVQPNYKFNNILICGMGGSAIGGDIVKSLISNDMILGEIPIHINRDYSVPGWVDSHTLVIFSSYSGNTEETISCYQECLSRNSFNIIMTSSGKLLDIAIKEKLPYSLIPKGYMPRQALGYSVSILLSILFSSISTVIFTPSFIVTARGCAPPIPPNPAVKVNVPLKDPLNFLLEISANVS